MQIIGNYKPRVYSERNVRQAMNRALKAAGLQCRSDGVEARSPKEQAHTYRVYKGTRSSPYSWHKDKIKGRYSHLLLWTNKLPTHIRDKKTKERVKLTGGDIVIINNRIYEHKAPRLPTFRGRWFARAVIRRKR